MALKFTAALLASDECTIGNVAKSAGLICFRCADFLQIPIDIFVWLSVFLNLATFLAISKSVSKHRFHAREVRPKLLRTNLVFFDNSAQLRTKRTYYCVFYCVNFWRILFESFLLVFAIFNLDHETKAALAQPISRGHTLS